jgi:hypothetical protein
VFHERIPTFLTRFRLGHVDQANFRQFLLEFCGSSRQPIRYRFVGNMHSVFLVVNQRFHHLFEAFDGLLTVRIFPSLISGIKWGLLIPSIFAASWMDTEIRGVVSSIRSFFDFSGGIVTGIRMPVFELNGIVNIMGNLGLMQRELFFFFPLFSAWKWYSLPKAANFTKLSFGERYICYILGIFFKNSQNSCYTPYF